MDNQNKPTQEHSQDYATNGTSQRSEHNPHSIISSKYLLMFVLMAVILSLISGGVFLFASKPNKPTLPKQITQPNQSPPTPIYTDPTANWNLYINSKYGYFIKYPDDWQVHENVSTPDFKSSLYTSITNGDLDVQDSINIFVENKTSPDAFLPSDVISCIKFEDSIFNNYNAKTATLTTEVSSMQKWIFINKGQQTFIINAWQLDYKNVDKILSTFKFLPVSPTGSDQNQPVSLEEMTPERAALYLPLHPSSVTVQKTGKTSIVNWTGTGGEGIYQIYRKAPTENQWTLINTVNTTENNRGTYTFEDKSAQVDGVYIYGVSIVNNFGKESIITESSPSE